MCANAIKAPFTALVAKPNNKLPRVRYQTVDSTHSMPAVARIAAVPSSAYFANKNVGTGKTITATGLSLTGTDAANYSLSSTSTTSTGTITAKALSLTYAGVNKVYDSTTIATVNVTDDRIAGDVLTIGRTAVFAFGDAVAEFLQRPKFLAEQAALRPAFRLRADLAGEQFQECALARSIRTEHRSTLPGPQLQGKCFECFGFSAPNGGIVDFKECHRD